MTYAQRHLAKTLGTPRRYFSELSIGRRAWEAVGCAGVSGALTGFALGTSLWLYLGTAGLASAGGIPAAIQHRTLRGAMIRATVGGFVWAVAVLVVFLAYGRDAVTKVPDPIGWYLVIATLPATAVGWLVWTIAHRLSQGALRAPQPPQTRRLHLPVVPLPAQVGEALPG